MSHVSSIPGIEIRDINALAAAAERCGMELVLDAKSFQAYNANKCDHKLRVKGDSYAYEMGIRKNSDGTYALEWDTWGSQGRKLMSHVGENAKNLNKYYASEVTKSLARRKGFKAQEQSLENGGLRLKIKRGSGNW